MANEPGRDDMHDLWRSQPVDPVPLPAEELRRRSLLCDSRARKAFWVGIAISLSSAALCIWFFFLIPHTAARIGFALTFGAELYFLHQFAKLRPDRLGRAEATGAAYRAQLLRRRDLTLSMWRKFLLPFVPGPALILLGFLVPERGVLLSVPLVSAYLVLPFALLIPLARRKARRIEREIAELDSQIR